MERCAWSFEVAFVETEEELVILVEALDRVPFAFGEVPDISGLEDFELVASFLVDGRNTHSTCVDVAPFGLRCVSLRKPSWRTFRDPPLCANGTLG